VVVQQVGDDWAGHPLVTGSPADHGIDAVVTIAIPVPGDLVARWEAQGVAVVVCGARVDGAECVFVNDVRAGRLATEHLTRLGHRRIALVRTHDRDGEVWRSDLVATVPFGPREGAAAIEQLWWLPDPPTAVFATCDEVAFGCVTGLRSRGLDVPRDVSVVGVDDHPLAEALGLSTVNQRVELQGELAGRLVLDALIGLCGPSQHEHHEVGLEMLARTSTAPVRPAARPSGSTSLGR
jgi:DNA-binding LacI/PurR family transcriptional regulator